MYIGKLNASFEMSKFSTPSASAGLERSCSPAIIDRPRNILLCIEHQTMKGSRNASLINVHLDESLSASWCVLLGRKSRFLLSSRTKTIKSRRLRNDCSERNRIERSRVQRRVSRGGKEVVGGLWRNDARAPRRKGIRRNYRSSGSSARRCSHGSISPVHPPFVAWQLKLALLITRCRDAC